MMKRHPETKHEMPEHEWDDHKENLQDHMDEHEEHMPEHHMDMLKGMKDEMDEYDDCGEDEETSEKAPSGLDEKMPKEPKDAEPMSIMIGFMNKKHSDKMKKEKE